MNNTKKPNNQLKYLFITPTFLFSIVAFTYLMIIASHNRLFADDYCYLLHLRARGLFNSIIDSYQYLNGRWLSHIVNYLFYSFDEFFIHSAPFLFLFLVFAINFVLSSLIELDRKKLTFTIPVAFFLTVLVILISPEFFLTSIWTLHVAILVGGITFMLVAIGLFLRLTMQQIPLKPQWNFLLFMLGLFSTAFHEGIAIMAFYVYCLLFLFEIKVQGRIRDLPKAAYLLAGAILGIISVFFSASNLNRARILNDPSEPSNFLMNFGLLIIKYVFFLAGEYQSDWRGLVIPLLSLLTGLIFSRFAKPFDKFAQNSFFSKFSTLTIFLPITASILVIIPFLFVGGYFPLRTYFVIGFILTFGNFVLGLWMSSIERIKKISLRNLYILWLCVFLFISISSVTRLNNYLDTIITYAQEFDQREAIIQDALIHNLRYVKVPKYSKLLDVEWVSDIENRDIDCNLENSNTYPIKLLLSENPPNCCLSLYYGIPILLEGSYR